jgi:hypothetical protein
VLSSWRPVYFSTAYPAVSDDSNVDLTLWDSNSNFTLFLAWRAASRPESLFLFRLSATQARQAPRVGRAVITCLPVSLVVHKRMSVRVSHSYHDKSDTHVKHLLWGVSSVMHACTSSHGYTWDVRASAVSCLGHLLSLVVHNKTCLYACPTATMTTRSMPVAHGNPTG